MHYSDPTHALLAKIAKSVDRLSETIEKQPHAEGSLLASTLAENIRLKETVQRLGEEMLVIRMDAAKDPALRAAIIDAYLHPRK
jgi:hypothetical protein